MKAYKIVLWGDSIAAMGAEPWIETAAFLFNVCLNTGRKVMTVNRSECGKPAAAARFEFENKIAKEHPDLVILQFGLNDIRYDGTRGNMPLATPSEFREHLHQMIRDCRNIPADVLVLGNHKVFSLLTLPNGKTYTAAVEQYNAEAEAAANMENADYIDMSHIGGDGVHFREMLCHDGIHLSEFGKQIYAQTIANYLSGKINIRS